MAKVLTFRTGMLQKEQQTFQAHVGVENRGTMPIKMVYFNDPAHGVFTW